MSRPALILLVCLLVASSAHGQGVQPAATVQMTPPTTRDSNSANIAKSIPQPTMLPPINVTDIPREPTTASVIDNKNENLLTQPSTEPKLSQPTVMTLTQPTDDQQLLQGAPSNDQLMFHQAVPSTNEQRLKPQSDALPQPTRHVRLNDLKQGASTSSTPSSPSSNSNGSPTTYYAYPASLLNNNLQGVQSQQLLPQFGSLTAGFQNFPSCIVPVSSMLHLKILITPLAPD